VTDFSPPFATNAEKIGKIGQKAQLNILQQCPKSAKPKLKKSGKNAGSENSSTKLNVNGVSLHS
jgi:hypothetical protein